MTIFNTNIIKNIINTIKNRKTNIKNMISFYNCFNSVTKIPGSDDAAKNCRVNTSKLYDYKVNLF